MEPVKWTVDGKKGLWFEVTEAEAEAVRGWGGTVLPLPLYTTSGLRPGNNALVLADDYQRVLTMRACVKGEKSL